MFSYKDKLPLSCRSSVVYYTQCNNCGPDAAYIGKTKNTLYERFYSSSGHLHPSSKNSALLGHLDQTGDPLCEFKFSDIKILDNAKTDFKLRFVESIILKYDKQNLNTQERSIENTPQAEKDHNVFPKPRVPSSRYARDHVPRDIARDPLMANQCALYTTVLTNQCACIFLESQSDHSLAPSEPIRERL